MTLPTVTWATARPVCGRTIGPVVTGGTATSGSTTALLECTQPLFQSTMLSSETFRDYYLLRPNAVLATDRVRNVNTYTPSTGVFVPDQVWTNSPYSGGVGEKFELYGGPVEPTTQMLDILNQALQRMFLVVEVPCTPLLHADRYDLSVLYPWLLRWTWVRAAGFLLAAEDRNVVDPFVTHPVRGRVTHDGMGTYLTWQNVTFDGTQTVYVRTVKRVYDHCATTAGPVLVVTNATNATPIQITTSTAHGYATGQLITIAGVTGNVAANGTWSIVVVDTTNFTLLNSVGTTQGGPGPTYGGGTYGSGLYGGGGTAQLTYPLQSGIVSDTDQLPVPAEWVAAAFACEAWDRVGHLLEATSGQREVRDRGTAAAWFSELTARYFQDPPLELQPIRHWGPRSYSWSWG